MGRDKLHPEEYTEEVKKNLLDTLEKVNELLGIWGGYAQVTSGWRPAAINQKAGGAKKSNHMLGKACDLQDKAGNLDKWCMANLKVLEDIGLWLEDPEATPGWTHIQTVSPKSGRRVFKP